MTYARKVDTNHSMLVKALRDMGCSVFDTSRTGSGFPDVVVGKNGITLLCEFKKDAKAPYTKAQQLFMMNWKGSAVARIHDIEGAINLVKLLEKS
jgi:Holliday junction resolvase